MKIAPAFRFGATVATCLPVLGALILASSPSAVSQEASSTTTTVTTQPVSVSPTASTLQTTTVTTVMPTSLYISKKHGNSLQAGAAIYSRLSGKVYNNDGDYIGHLTNMEGYDVSALPVRDEFKIRNPSGNIIASTRPSSAFDSDRKVFLSRKDEPVPATTSSTTTTRQTTTTGQ